MYANFGIPIQIAKHRIYIMTKWQQRHTHSTLILCYRFFFYLRRVRPSVELWSVCTRCDVVAIEISIKSCEFELFAIKYTCFGRHSRKDNTHTHTWRRSERRESTKGEKRLDRIECAEEKLPIPSAVHVIRRMWPCHVSACVCAR